VTQSIFILASIFLISGQAALAMGKGNNEPPVETVPYVNLNQYLGKWYEIVRKPVIFERNCVGVTADYSLREDGKINVENSCRKKTCDGETSTSIGKAKVVDPVSNAKLKVSFFGPFYSPYWILELGKNYEYAVVGSPNRQYFWVLSRTPALDRDVLRDILSRFVKKGFDLDDLIFTESCGQ
jgi:apolipoprotein D and lipocalin family protein